MVSSQPAQVLGKYFTIKQTMRFTFFSPQLVCSLGAGRALVRARLPNPDPFSAICPFGDSKGHHEPSLALARSDWSVFLLCISHLLSSAVSRSSGDCISGS